MKKIFKTIFIYLGVLLLAGIATVVFCAGFLFFYRDGNIFGIQYISTNEILIAKENEDMSSLKTIEVNSDSFDVFVRVNPNASSVMGAMRNDVFGYVKKSKAHASFSLEYDESTQTAVFNSVQPRGWLNKNKSYMEIAIPKNFANLGLNIIVKTSKADIQIGNEHDLTIGELQIISSKGDADFTNINLTNNINLNIGSGIVFIDQKCSSSSGVGLQISLGSGTVNLSKINTDNFDFGVIEIKSIKKGKVGILKAKELITDGNISGGGKIEVGEINRVYFSSLDTDISINNIKGFSEGFADSEIKITGRGDVWVKNADCNLEINGHNGDIYVNTSTGTVDLSANQGDIKMDNAMKLVSATTSYGNINIQFNEAALDYDESLINNKNRVVIATTKNGHINVKGMQNAHVEATGKGRITLEFDKVVGNNNVSAQSGVVNIVVPNPTETSVKNEYAFNLIINSEVNSDIKVGVVGSLGTTVDYNGSGSKTFTNIYNDAASTSNNLKVESTTGFIKIRSKDLVGF